MMDWVAMGRTYKFRWQLEGEKFLYQVGLWTSIRQCLNEVYRELVKLKKCQPIESLPSEEKKRLWAMAQAYKRERQEDDAYFKELCRGFHALETVKKLNL